MISALFYERRKVAIPIDSNDHRMAHRRNHPKPFSPERRRLASQIRRYERETFRIPVRLQIPGGEISGYTHDISSGGLLIFGEGALTVGTPVSLQFCFGENVCYLNISGQVVFCRTIQDNGSTSQAIGIKFSAIRDLEQKILTSAVQELRQNSATHEKSLLTIFLTKDILALEVANYSSGSISQDRMKIAKPFYERRRFELPISFADRREEMRRRKERRQVEQEAELALIESLKIKINSLGTHPRESIKLLLGQITRIDPAEVDESTEIRSLDLDSFRMIEILAAIETIYNITLEDDALFRIVTVKDLIDLIQMNGTKFS